MSKQQRRSLADVSAARGPNRHPEAETVRAAAAQMDEPKKQIHAFIPASLHRAFKLRAVNEGRSMNEVLEELMQGFVEK